MVSRWFSISGAALVVVGIAIYIASGVALGAPVAASRGNSKQQSTIACKKIPSSTLSGHMGAVAGYLQLSGGPVRPRGGPRRGVSACGSSGHITLMDSANHVVASADVANGHYFRVIVQSGTYKLTASLANGGGPCVAQRVSITATHQKIVSVVCSVP
jgi:hypothetical protein